MKREQKIEKKDYGKFLLLALFQPFFYFLGESFGLTYISSTIAAVIISFIPVLTPIFAWMFIREKITILNLIGIIVSFGGILLIFFHKDLTFDASPLGVFLEFCAVASAIAYSIVVKKLVFKYSSLTIIKTQNILGAIYFLPLFLIFDFKDFISITPDSSLIYAMLMLSVFASSGAYLLYIPVIKELGINRANIFTNLIPVMTAVLSYFILTETFDLAKIVGMIIVILGISISQIYKQFNKMFY